MIVLAIIIATKLLAPREAIAVNEIFLEETRRWGVAISIAITNTITK